MGRIFYVLCESGIVPRNLREKGFAWIHLDCMMKLFHFRSDMKTIKEFMEGKRTNDTVERFLERMEEFDKKWEKTTSFLKEQGSYEVSIEDLKKLENYKKGT